MAGTQHHLPAWVFKNFDPGFGAGWTWECWACLCGTAGLYRRDGVYAKTLECREESGLALRLSEQICLCGCVSQEGMFVFHLAVLLFEFLAKLEVQVQGRRKGSV